MAILNPTVNEVQILKAPGAVDNFGLALVTFDTTGTYVQADDCKLLAVATLIQSATRNGKTVTLVDVAAGQHSYRSDTGLAVGLKTVAISTADVTFEVTLSTTTAYSTSEFTNATALPTLLGPMGILVVYTEA